MTSLLTAKRDPVAARRFLERATSLHDLPEKITINKSGAKTAAIESVRGKRKFVVTPDSKHDPPIAPNLLERNFTPEAPNQVWTSDITYIATDGGWLYPTGVIDLFRRQAVAWSMRDNVQTTVVTDALRMARFRRRPPLGLTFQSDREQNQFTPSWQPREEIRLH